MSAHEWEEAVARLARRLSAAFAGIERRLEAPRAELERPPGAGGWSALEIAEHVVLANHHLLLLVEKIAARSRARTDAGEPPPAQVSRLDHLERLAEPGFRWESPEHMLPRGLATPKEIAACLREQRGRSIELLSARRRGEGALHAISMSVVGGKLDLYQYLALVALHMERHAKQMDRALRG